MKNKLLKLLFASVFLFTGWSSVYADSIQKDSLLTKVPSQYEKVEFNLSLVSAFSNPFSQAELKVDMILTAPSSKSIVLPCFYVSGTSDNSAWKARFAPQENGTYTYFFRITKVDQVVAISTTKFLSVVPTAQKGILHKNNNWSFKFDNGEVFRGIGENVGWEARNYEKQSYKYDYFLPKLAANGANFFRTWMHVFNMPLEWKTVKNTNFYKSSTEYFNPTAIKRIDSFFQLIDSLGMHAMMAMDVHGAFLDDWPQNNYNVVNGGPCTTPLDFFTLPAAQAKYKDRLRYMIARWGYSPGLGAFEFFNEVDNASYSSTFGAKIGSAADASITAWHTMMSKYIKDTDPYGHLVTTSISHREISGLNNVPDIDFNQKHIYWGVTDILNHIKNFTQTNKPYVIGEFGFSADGAYTNDPTGAENDFTFKRGLWYGIFSTTPILPMTWWWEAFDSRNMQTYFRGVRAISDQMLAASKGDMTKTTIAATGIESYAVKCGNRYFVYLLNSGSSAVNTSATLTVTDDAEYTVKSFIPTDLTYTDCANLTSASKKITISNLSMNSRDEIIYIIAPVGDELGINMPYSGTPIDLPGKLEAEDFDKCGEGVAYHDQDLVNTGNKYRTDEGVDVEEKDGGGYDVTNTIKGEWTEYTINSVGATYTLNALVAAIDDSRSFRVLIDGNDVTGRIAVPKTSGMQDWTTVSVTTQPIAKGLHTLRIFWETSGINVDYLTFTVVNQMPSVNITSPEAGSTITLPDKVNITVEATDADGSVSKVEFYNGTTKLGESVTAPYSYTWTPSAAGTVKLIAKATDNAGLVFSSNRIYLTIASSTIQLPYETTPYTIPGKIEAENYDLGVDGVAYHDLTKGNKFSVYRSEDVDIETCTDTGGGYDLGDFEAGEWVEYTVNVEQNGVYNFDFRVAANQSSMMFHLLIDDVDVTGQITVPNTGGWQTFVTISVPGISLTSGQKVIRFYCDKGYFNTNYINVIRTGDMSLKQSVVKVGFYPNPVQNLLTLENNLLNADNAKIFNVLGELVSDVSIHQNIIDLSGLQSGVYGVTLINSQTKLRQNITILKK